MKCKKCNLEMEEKLNLEVVSAELSRPRDPLIVIRQCPKCKDIDAKVYHSSGGR
jgi:hypothetical protein